MTKRSAAGTRVWLLGALAASSVIFGASQADTPADQPPATAKPATTAKPAANATTATGKSARSKTAAGKTAAAARPRYKPDRFAGRAGTYFKQVWGVDSLGVKTVESGEVLRFSYRVLDSDRARALNDEKTEPSLIDPRAGVSLVIPTMEKVGKLRQTEPPEEGKSYWMAFSNKGRLVKRGDRVDVVIGQFRATGLVVD